jgi:hypothetical protein
MTTAAPRGRKDNKEAKQVFMHGKVLALMAQSYSIQGQKEQSLWRETD